MPRDHDPLCLSLLPYGPGDLCDCGTIRAVRADEREQAATRMYLQREHMRGDLRAQVEALPSVIGGISRADVLALLGGGA